MGVIKKLNSISKIQILAVILILAGLFIAVRYSIRTFEAFREAQFAYNNNFAAGNLDPDLLRPWMTIRYIAVAYTVPIEYLLSELNLELEGRNINAPVNDLNDRFFKGQRQDDGRPIIIDRLQAAIVSYRQNPVPTGLRERGVRPWMSIQYIANSTGIPAEYFFEQLGIPIDGNAYLPLDGLIKEVQYEPGLRSMVEKIQQIVDTYEADQ